MDNKSVVGWTAVAAFLLLAASAPVAAQGSAMSGWSMPQETLVLPLAPVAQDVIAASQVDETVSAATAGLYNRHLATNLQTTMGGATVYVAGQFLRDQKTAYLVLSSNRFRVPLFFNLKGLLENEVNISLGGVNYKIYLDWSVRGLMQAQVKIQPSDGSSIYAVTLQQLLDSTFAAGKSVPIGGIDHRLAYYSEITGSPQGALDASRRTYALMSQDPRDPSTYFTYVFPEEDLVSGAEHVYTFPNNPIRTMKVTLSGGVLQIHAIR